MNNISFEALTYFILANLLDIITTKKALEQGAYELNPLANYFIKVFGVKGLFILKYSIIALILIGTTSEFIMWILNAIITLIILWNSITLARMSKK